jgi:hypothetical protein
LLFETEEKIRLCLVEPILTIFSINYGYFPIKRTPPPIKA